MEKLPLNLEDLVPKETAFTLSTCEGKSFTLCRWSLRVRAWATSKYTSQGLNKIFKDQNINDIAEIAWFMLKDKNAFSSFDEIGGFLDRIVSMQDQINVIVALLGSVGFGEPEIDKIMAAQQKADPQDPKTQSPK